MRRFLTHASLLCLCAVLFAFLPVTKTPASVDKNAISFPLVFAEGDNDGGAVSNPGDDDGGAVSNPGDNNGGGNTDQGDLRNPLLVDSIPALFNLILEIVRILAIPIIVFFIIYSGFLYVTAQGKPEQIQKATTAFTWTIIGGAIILGASVLLDIIVNTVGGLRSSP